MDEISVTYKLKEPDYCNECGFWIKLSNILFCRLGFCPTQGINKIIRPQACKLATFPIIYETYHSKDFHFLLKDISKNASQLPSKKEGA